MRDVTQSIALHPALAVLRYRMIVSPLSGTHMRIASSLLLVLLAGPLGAQHPIPASERVSGHLSYDGHGTFGDFVGSTDSVVGHLSAANDLSRVSGYVAARAATLRTGNGKRDRDQWSSLEVDRFPFIRYDVDSVTVGAAHGDTLAVTLHGRFDIHGVRRDVDLPSRLVLTPTSAHLMAATPLDLHDHKISGLTKFFGALKMDPAIVVHIDVTFAFGPS
jgi:polyisoprenoid-binding protein YceI